MYSLLEEIEVAQNYHIPAMVKESLHYLNLRPGMTIIDATAGTGGHSLAICERIMPGGCLVAIDRDQDSLNVARERLEKFSGSCIFVHSNFVDIDTILNNLGIDKADGVLFDLGISSFQLDNAERGFSFREDAPLDMRMDKDGYISAYDLINNLNEDELSVLLWNFGEERWHRRIAHFLVREREKHPISTTSELARIVEISIPQRYRNRHYRIHPATRTFQAVRIAVNRELEILDTALNKAISMLKKKARICVISFHSLEDRIVKFGFRDASAKGTVEILTDKPLTPSQAEISDNPRSRSSKMRVAERI